MRFEINFTKKRLFVLFVFMFFIFGSIFVYANWDVSKNVWHSSNDVKVNVGGNDYSLQEAIDLGLFGSKVIQVASNSTNSVFSINDIIPYDNTIPQKDEGIEILNVTVVPRAIGSKLRVSAMINADGNDQSVITSVALFKDNDNSALSVVSTQGEGANVNSLILRYELTSASLDPITFKIRVGPHISSGTTINGVGGSKIFNGASRSNVWVEEVLS